MRSEMATNSLLKLHHENYQIKSVNQKFKCQHDNPFVLSNLQNEDQSTYTFSITGCQGVATSWWKQAKHSGHNLAAIQRKVAQHMAIDADARILLGDNIYMAGATSPTDRQFQNNYHDIYTEDLPSYVILGNHDYNIQKPGPRKVFGMFGPKPFDRALAQVEHSYGANAGTWKMPYRYYAIELAHANIFFLDTNTLPYDSPQQGWLESTYKKLNPDNSNKFNIVAQHHPLISSGKRNPKNPRKSKDCKDYLIFSDCALGEGEEKKNMNELIHQHFVELYEEEKFFDLFLVAHDHFLEEREIIFDQHSKKVSIQLTVGGGGSNLESPEDDSSIQNPYLRGYLSSPAFDVSNEASGLMDSSFSTPQTQFSTKSVMSGANVSWKVKKFGDVKLKITKDKLDWTFFSTSSHFHELKAVRESSLTK